MLYVSHWTHSGDHVVKIFSFTNNIIILIVWKYTNNMLRWIKCDKNKKNMYRIFCESSDSKMKDFLSSISWVRHHKVTGLKGCRFKIPDTSLSLFQPSSVWSDRVVSRYSSLPPSKGELSSVSKLHADVQLRLMSLFIKYLKVKMFGWTKREGFILWGTWTSAPPKNTNVNHKVAPEPVGFILWGTWLTLSLSLSQTLVFVTASAAQSSPCASLQVSSIASLWRPCWPQSEICCATSEPRTPGCTAPPSSTQVTRPSTRPEFWPEPQNPVVTVQKSSSNQENVPETS